MYFSRDPPKYASFVKIPKHDRLGLFANAIRELTECANNSVLRGGLANTCWRTVPICWRSQTPTPYKPLISPWLQSIFAGGSFVTWYTILHP